MGSDLDGSEPPRPLGGPRAKRPKTKQKTTPKQETEKMATNTNTEAEAAVAGVGAKEHTVQGMDAGRAHASDFDADSQRSKAVRFDEDVNTSERFRVETADRSGMWAAADYAAIMSNQRYSDANAEQRLKHQSKIDSLEIAERQQDHAQRVRFADANASIQIALLADMAEKLGEIHGIVCKDK